MGKIKKRRTISHKNVPPPTGGPSQADIEDAIQAEGLSRKAPEFLSGVKCTFLPNLVLCVLMIANQLARVRSWSHMCSLGFVFRRYRPRIAWKAQNVTEIAQWRTHEKIVATNGRSLEIGAPTCLGRAPVHWSLFVLIPDTLLVQEY